MSPPERVVRVLVGGLVQGVFFRQSTLEEAVAAGVKGWVRNLRDGRVEAQLEGSSEAVDRVLSWIREGGPAAARVDTCEVGDAEAGPAADRFTVRS